MNTVRVRYLREVVTPTHLAGEVGDEREMALDDAARLAGEGYVEILGGTHGDPDSD